jgi:hypothetical protein
LGVLAKGQMTSCSDTLAQWAASCGQKPAGDQNKCYNTVTGRQMCITGHAITQAFCRRSNTPKTQVSIPGVCIGYFDTRTNFFFLLLWSFPIFIIQLLLHSINSTTIDVAQTYKQAASLNYTIFLKNTISLISCGCSQICDVDLHTIYQLQKGLALSRHVLVAEGTV